MYNRSKGVTSNPPFIFLSWCIKVRNRISVGIIPKPNLKEKGIALRREVGSTRKVRTDKKRDVKPTISYYVKESLYDYSSIIEEPVKDAAEKLVEVGLKSETILLLFQPIMIGNYRLENRFFIGNRPLPVKIYYRGATGKVTIKFNQETYEQLRNLAFAIGHPPTSTAALMIRKTLYSYDFMEYFIERHLDYLDNRRKVELQRFLREMRQIDREGRET